MYLSALVETGGASVPALPNEAVISYQGRKYIFVLSEEIHQEGKQDESANSKVEQPREENQHFSMVEIQVSNSELGYTEVTVPDSVSNSQIVIKGAYSILSKMKNSEEEGGHAH
jgi:cobalt-zinc-cadmium efflux system membrane fusion protein